MDILITDSTLREFLDTKATPEKLAECISLCGPSIERITKVGRETVYHVEVTTNRVDAASAYGLAREAAAILPKFGIAAKLKTYSFDIKGKKPKLDIDIQIDKNLCERFVAVKLADITIGEAPQFMKDRLTAMEQRPINNVIDITNYVMFAYGIPMHAFDCDKLGKKIVVREAHKGESFKTLDDRHHKALGGEIVFDNGAGEIVDIPGVMGTANSAVTQETKNVLLVMEHMDPLKVRETSLKHELRTHAATLNEKDPDPNEISKALELALIFFDHPYAKATIASEIFDWYPNPRKSESITVSKEKILKSLGVEISTDEILKILTSLEFKTVTKKDTLIVTPPTYRAADITIPEDVIEEIARLYGYFNLPSNLPEGKIPTEARDPQYAFEYKIKNILKGFGGIEVLTLSMVSKEMADNTAPKIKNPLGAEGEYMRSHIVPSLLLAAQGNTQEKESFHLFEVANTYKTQGKKLSLEESKLAGIFAHTDYRHAKGVVEALFEMLHIEKLSPTLTKQGNYFVYEFSIMELLKAHSEHTEYTPVPQYPSQIEDVTLLLEDIKVGDVIQKIKETSKLVSEVKFLNSYEESSSFRISYQSSEKTLTDSEVTEVRKEILKTLQRHGITEK